MLIPLIEMLIPLKEMLIPLIEILKPLIEMLIPLIEMLMFTLNTGSVLNVHTSRVFTVFSIQTDEFCGWFLNGLWEKT